jgi:hypothetical protein
MPSGAIDPAKADATARRRAFRLATGVSIAAAGMVVSVMARGT